MCTSYILDKKRTHFLLSYFIQFKIQIWIKIILFYACKHKDIQCEWSDNQEQTCDKKNLKNI